ncbi:hypothetical protein GINT2_000888 [Glugoides intestinalis]
MRKTYKPLARVEKASQMFRKKTLNVNDDLNIKHDEDDIENVDDYWSTAMSVIGNSTIDSIDNGSVTEPSDTLFNIKDIRKSIKTDERNTQKPSKVEHLYRKSVNTTNVGVKKDDEVPVESFNKGLDMPDEYKEEEKKGAAMKLFNIEEDESLIPISDDNENTGGYGDSSVLPAFDIDIDDIPENKETYEEIGLKTFDKGGDMPALKSYNLKKAALKSSTSVEHIKKQHSAEKTRIEGHNPKLGDNKQKLSKKNQRFEIENIATGFKSNSVAPLLCTKSMDIAVMNLEYLAFIEGHQTESAFSLFVVKGKIELTVNDKCKTLAKGGVSVVEKDEIYSLNCISRGGAILLLSYAL